MALVIAAALLLTGCSTAREAGGPGTAESAAASASAAGAPAPGGATDEQAPGPPQEGYFSTEGAQIVDSSDRPVRLRGVNWFGFDTTACSLRGLDVRPVGEILDDMAGAGFTVVRVPFANACLDATPALDALAESRNPEWVGLTALEQMDALVDSAGRRNLKILFDRHSPEGTDQPELWYTDAYPETRWIDDWVRIATRYQGDPTVIGADLSSGVHGTACWGCGDEKRDWAGAATRAGNAIQQVNPDWLIVVQGVEANSDGTVTWWGGALRDAGTNPITLDVANRVVYSPHEYAASVYEQPWFSDPEYPANLPAVWDRNWGYLAQNGTAPVLIGEFGTEYETPSDQQWLQTLVGYIEDNDLSYAYWAWNPDSDATGGLVTDDWKTPEQAKIDALTPILG